MIFVYVYVYMYVCMFVGWKGSAVATGTRANSREGKGI